MLSVRLRSNDIDVTAPLSEKHNTRLIGVEDAADGTGCGAPRGDYFRDANLRTVTAIAARAECDQEDGVCVIVGAVCCESEHV